MEQVGLEGNNLNTGTGQTAWHGGGGTQTAAIVMWRTASYYYAVVIL